MAIMESIEENVKININVSEKIDSLYKLGYLIVDLNSICNFSVTINEQNMKDLVKTKEYPIDITSRYFNNESKDKIKLINFSQGSFCALITAPLIVGVILLIIEKYINKENNNKGKIEIHVNNPTIIKTVNIIYNNNLSIEENTDNIIKELNEKNILKQNGIIYDKNGKKILFHHIDRLEEQLKEKNLYI